MRPRRRRWKKERKHDDDDFAPRCVYFAILLHSSSFAHYVHAWRTHPVYNKDNEMDVKFNNTLTTWNI